MTEGRKIDTISQVWWPFYEKRRGQKRDAKCHITVSYSRRHSSYNVLAYIIIYFTISCRFSDLNFLFLTLLVFKEVRIFVGDFRCACILSVKVIVSQILDAEMRWCQNCCFWYPIRTNSLDLKIGLLF